MMLRNMAACSVWHRSSEPVQHSTKTWSQATTVPVLVARLQAAPQPPEQVLMHILKTLANFAATGAPHLIPLMTSSACSKLKLLDHPDATAVLDCWHKEASTSCVQYCVATVCA